LDQYASDGYAHITSVFSEEECVDFKNELLKQIGLGKKQLEAENNAANQGGYDRNKIADAPRAIHKGMLQDIADRSRIFMDIAKDERILSCVRPIVGEDIVMYRSLSVFKPGGHRARVGWHQDMAYWRGDDNKVSVWVSLDDVDKETGAMQFIPGSQKKLFSDTETQDEVFSIVVQGKHVDDSQSVVAETKRGDIVLFHSTVIHGSGQNVTGKDRYTLIFTYQPASDQSHHRGGPPTTVS